MQNKITPIKFAAVCSLIGALTTNLLIFMPNPQVSGEDATALLHTNAMYIIKKWKLFIHPQVNYMACLGIALGLFKE